jgi:hypothetical protein
MSQFSTSCISFTRYIVYRVNVLEDMVKNYNNSCFLRNSSEMCAVLCRYKEQEVSSHLTVIIFNYVYQYN